MTDRSKHMHATRAPKSLKCKICLKEAEDEMSDSDASAKSVKSEANLAQLQRHIVSQHLPEPPDLVIDVVDYQARGRQHGNGGGRDSEKAKGRKTKRTNAGTRAAT